MSSKAQRRAKRRAIATEMDDRRFIAGRIRFAKERTTKHRVKAHGRASSRILRDDQYKPGSVMPHKAGTFMHKGHYHPLFKNNTGKTWLAKADK